MARTFVGTVSSDATDKTIVVTVSRSKTHPLYRKRYMVTKKFMAHDEKNEAKVGDRVRIVECRPMSARKRFKLDQIIERATVVDRVEDVTPEVAEVIKKSDSQIVESSDSQDDKTVRQSDNSDNERPKKGAKS
ncbi:30S ribosomal protein S17 [Candidatus Saccharibacteria bacterium]|nr:30S ribosomal protein S17 [Candidatus Saccharibacteria bacterium]